MYHKSALQATQLEDGCFLQALNIWGTINTHPWKAAWRLLSSRAFSCFSRHHPQSQAALEGSINISLFRTTILGHWREPFNVRQVPMFPRCCYRVLGEEPRRRLAHRLPFKHPKAIFLVDLITGERLIE